jgi:hypothetical protein
MRFSFCADLFNPFIESQTLPRINKTDAEDGSGTDAGDGGFLNASNSDVAVAADNPSISVATCARIVSLLASRSLS